MITAQTPRIGEHWRDDLDGYVVKIVAFNKQGWPYVRHVNAKSGGHSANPAWFKHWTRTR